MGRFCRADNRRVRVRVGVMCIRVHYWKFVTGSCKRIKYIIHISIWVGICTSTKVSIQYTSDLVTFMVRVASQICGYNHRHIFSRIVDCRCTHTISIQWLFSFWRIYPKPGTWNTHEAIRHVYTMYIYHYTYTLLYTYRYTHITTHNRSHTSLYTYTQ